MRTSSVTEQFPAEVGKIVNEETPYLWRVRIVRNNPSAARGMGYR